MVYPTRAIHLLNTEIAILRNQVETHRQVIETIIDTLERNGIRIDLSHIEPYTTEPKKPEGSDK